MSIFFLPSCATTVIWGINPTVNLSFFPLTSQLCIRVVPRSSFAFFWVAQILAQILISCLHFCHSFFSAFPGQALPCFSWVKTKVWRSILGMLFWWKKWFPWELRHASPLPSVSVPCPCPGRSWIAFYSNTQSLGEPRKHCGWIWWRQNTQHWHAGFLLTLHPHHISTYPGNFMQVVN